MNNINGKKFQIFVDGIQTGNIGGWRHIPLMVSSSWELGSDGEQFEVLSAMRRNCSPESANDFYRGEKRTPNQVARAEGFTKLNYKRTISSSLPVEIVKAIAPYRHMVSQSKFKLIEWMHK